MMNAQVINSQALLTDDDKYKERTLGSEEAQKIFKWVKSAAGSDGSLKVSVHSFWYGAVRWGRNRPSMTTDSRNVNVSITRTIGFSETTVNCNQTDEKSLADATRYVEHYARLLSRKILSDHKIPVREYESSVGNVWSQDTYDVDRERERNLLSSLVQESEHNALLSAGYLESFATSVYRFHRDHWARESASQNRLTQAQFSMTARSLGTSPSDSNSGPVENAGQASGWAGRSSYDYKTLELESLGRMAIEKCIASLSPARIEPGRYTTILEPQAAHKMFSILVGALDRVRPEGGSVTHPFFLGSDHALGRFRSRIGLRVVDKRINITHDPADPLTSTPEQAGVMPVDLIKDGVLVKMFNTIEHEISELAGVSPTLYRDSFSVKGEDVSIESMIESTGRGLIVTKFSDMMNLDNASLLYTGFTRDGLWLIEEGKITRAVRNFRFTESPIFALNNLEQLGIPEPVWNPVVQRDVIVKEPARALASAMVPPVKVRDFSFTSSIDAI